MVEYDNDIHVGRGPIADVCLCEGGLGEGGTCDGRAGAHDPFFQVYMCR